MVSDLRGCTAGETHVVILGLKTPGNNNTRLYHHLPPTHPIRDHSPPCVTPIILTTTDSDPLLTAVDEILILICVYVYVYLYVSAPYLKSSRQISMLIYPILETFLQTNVTVHLYSSPAGAYTCIFNADEEA
ncbi:hypothetical protein EYR41_001861 [Orbilia oligospora]|uniref:Uncharacterized protein n=1 Tax=Orbilia oligospora TaxID=2813651 RepID=A0A8H2EFK4_ORBOL|nr:hypothetical protein TWF217_011235 [Orbilia oligospora]KAF3260067.1 hypothetical protein TWF128_003552 [Orbilia oligospora]TGJ74904.1 hypothetical protein EYR41_001861 [Orbilia oligospora]